MDTFFLSTSSVCDFTHQACHCRTWGRSWPARATPSTWTSFQWSPTGRSLLQTRASFQQSSRGQNVSWLIWNSGNNCHLRLRNIFAILLPFWSARHPPVEHRRFLCPWRTSSGSWSPGLAWISKWPSPYHPREFASERPCLGRTLLEGRWFQ